MQGEPGGRLTVSGTSYGRDDAAATRRFMERMGEPDGSITVRSCSAGPGGVPATIFRWGDLEVSVLDAQPEGEYGFSYPKGAISGWTISEGTDGQPGLAGRLTGPSGTTIGTPLATLKKRFTTNEWDQAGVQTIEGRRVFEIFAGDTTGASFELGDGDTVTEITAGASC